MSAPTRTHQTPSLNPRQITLSYLLAIGLPAALVLLLSALGQQIAGVSMAYGQLLAAAGQPSSGELARYAAELSTLQNLQAGVVVLSLVALALEGVYLFRPIVRQVSAALAEHTRTETILRNREAVIRTLYDVASAPQLDVLVKVETLLQMGCAQFGLPIGILSRIEGEAFKVVAAHDPSEGIRAGTQFALADTYCAETITASAPIGIQHASQGRWREHRCYQTLALESYLGTPVVVQGEIVGTLCFASATPRADGFSAVDQDLIRLMAQWIGGELARAEAEIALRDSEDRFQRLASVTTEGVTISEQGLVVDTNTAAADMLGYSEAELRGRALLDMVAPQSRARAAHALATDSGPAEILVQRRDGTRFPVEMVGRNIPYHGRLARVTTFRDVTAQRLAESSLRASEERFRQLAEHISKVFWMSTPAIDQILYVSPAYAEIWGQPCSALYDQPASMFAAIRPDDQARVIATHQARHAQGYDIEYQIVRPDGEVRWIWTRAFPVLNEAGRVYRIAGISEDISERKQAEAELRTALAELDAQYQVADRAQSESRAILDASGEAMVLVAPNGRFLSVNRRFGELFGVPASQVLGRYFAELVVELGHIFADPAALQTQLGTSARDEERRFTQLLAQRWPQARELELFSAPVHTANQRYLGRLYIFRDVTHERAVDRMKSEFVAMVSHELRTPLTSIKGYIDMLLDGDAGAVSEPHQELLQIVKNNADRLLALINDLLDLSQIEAGRLVLQRVHLDPSPLIRQAATMLRPQLAAKQLRLELDLPNGPRPQILGDPVRLTQVITNLLSNAIKYTPAAGSIAVQLRVEPQALTIAVRDSGVGISAEEQEQLFSRFFRANNRATREAGGTGLGLAITRSIVELHDGQIAVESQPGQGSLFRVTLPLAALGLDAETPAQQDYA